MIDRGALATGLFGGDRIRVQHCHHESVALWGVGHRRSKLASAAILLFVLTAVAVTGTMWNNNELIQPEAPASCEVGSCDGVAGVFDSPLGNGTLYDSCRLRAPKKKISCASKLSRGCRTTVNELFESTCVMDVDVEYVENMAASERRQEVCSIAAVNTADLGGGGSTAAISYSDSDDSDYRVGLVGILRSR